MANTPTAASIKWLNDYFKRCGLEAGIIQFDAMRPQAPQNLRKAFWPRLSTLLYSILPLVRETDTQNTESIQVMISSDVNEMKVSFRFKAFILNALLSNNDLYASNGDFEFDQVIIKTTDLNEIIVYNNLSDLLAVDQARVISAKDNHMIFHVASKQGRHVAFSIESTRADVLENPPAIMYIKTEEEVEDDETVAA